MIAWGCTWFFRGLRSFYWLIRHLSYLYTLFYCKIRYSRRLPYSAVIIITITQLANLMIFRSLKSHYFPFICYLSRSFALSNLPFLFFCQRKLKLNSILFFRSTIFIITNLTFIILFQIDDFISLIIEYNRFVILF